MANLSPLFLEFTAAMARLGPFEPAPRLAAGVSGGADSMALALLANTWARERGGSLLALIVDHGLRRDAAAEAAEAASRLAGRGISARVLRLEGLARGPAMAERARDARFRVLVEACAADGILHLLLAHHAADQAETVLIRELGGSGPAGLAGMAALLETAGLRMLRPLLNVPPNLLRTLLEAEGVGWCEDPSNRDMNALRPRLRMLRRDREGAGPATMALVAAAAAAGRQRVEQEDAIAHVLAACASIRPEGFALLDPPVPAAALMALMQAIAGTDYPPPTHATARLAASMEPATLAGVRLMRAGRLGAGWLLVREAAAVGAAVPAVPGAVWDGRFRLVACPGLPAGAMLGALGDDAPRLRHVSPLPAAVLRTLPAVRMGEQLLAVPHLHYPDRKGCEGIDVVFAPSRPAAGAPYRFGDA
jgi:tRNA(Ile)-lysidine synthase